jgi:hypothetical protein
MAQLYPPASLLGLPDELILQIISSFEVIRSDEPQSQAFRDKTKEKSRQRQNHDGQAVLHALCLTSRTLNRVSTSRLYSSFVGSTTLHGIGLLRSFLATVTSKPELGNHIEYVENRLSDYLGNDLLHDMDFHEAETMVAEYFVRLAILVRRSPNIRHLCVVSIESIDISFWRHLLPDASLVPRCDIADHGFPKLQTLALQTNTKQKYAQVSPAASFSVIFIEMGAAPNLSRIRASGLEFGLAVSVWQPFATLRHIDLTEVESEFEDVDRILSACNDLERFTCQWAYLSMRESSIDLLPSISRHKNTLKTLWLAASASQYDTANTPVVNLNNLSSLTALTEAKLSNFGVRDRYSLPPSTAWTSPLLSTRLPSSIQHLTIMYPTIWTDTVSYSFDVLTELWRLAENRAQLLPNLRELVILFEDGPLWAFDSTTGASQGDTSLLTARLHDAGVRFKIVDELEACT